MEVDPFRIHVEGAVLDDLAARLRRARWSEGGDGAGWARGTRPAYLRALVETWLGAYDWRAHEAEINALPQFIAPIHDARDGARIHFVHARGNGPSPTPLLLLHGWPDSFLRFRKVLPLLADGYDVVVPSLPGFAFTGAVRRGEGERPARVTARLLWKLMTESLGYDRFAVAGGDGGSVIAQILAIEHPEAVIGIHLTDLGWHALNVDPATVSRPERKFLEAVHKAQMADGAYALVQMTTPRSLASALADSPVGLASWIVDRFHSWVDGDLDAVIGRQDLLTDITLYWVTQTIGASILNYYAEARSPSLTTRDRVTVPVGLLLGPAEPGGIPPRAFAERTLAVRHWTELPRGGHFLPLEQPAAYARDVIDFFQPLLAPAPLPRGSRPDLSREAAHGIR